MHDIQTRYGAYKRGVIYFTIYSAVLFFATSADFLQLKTILYFLLGYAISGAVAALFMSLQYKIEKGLSPSFWILNIVIDIAGYFVYTYALFSLMY
tara:strand:+ start:125 stop:412 length:288 start_codon:yes stop_codon:yes gene_type:complete